MDDKPATSRPYATFAIYALIALSMWSPPPEMPLAAVVDLLRYALFMAASVAIVVHTYARQGFRVSLSPDWLFLIGFLFYTSLSVLWGTGSPDAIIKSMLIFSAMLVSVSIANAQGLDRTLRMYYKSMCVFVILSLLVVVLFPGIGIETGWELEGDWKGIAGQKNGLGHLAGLALVAALALPVRRGPDGRLLTAALFTRAAMLAIIALCLINSSSRGALLLAGIGIASLLIARAPRLLQRIILVALVLFAIPLLQLGISTVELSADQIGILGTKIDTNSRTILWSYGLEQLDGRELLGFGVGSFWTPARITAFKDVNGWVLDNFHNGYITILIEGGAIGLSLLLIGIAFIMILFVVAIGNLKNPYLGLAFGFTNMFLVGNLVENSIGRSTSLNFILFLVISFALRPYVAGLLGSRSARNPAPGSAAPWVAGPASAR